MALRELDQSGNRLLDVARRSLEAAGYTGPLLREDYAFADVLADSSPLQRASLAAFGQEPPSYRTACWGVTLRSISGSEELGDVRDLRALGAPQILVLYPEETSRWKISSDRDPELLERIPTDRLTETFTARRSIWSPESVLRAKGIAFDDAPRQLDFYDAGLIPTLDQIVYDKLDTLLRRALASAKAAYSEHRTEIPDYPGLFRLIFRLLAAKVLGDRHHPGTWLAEDPRQAISAVEQLHFRGEMKRVLNERAAQIAAWRVIRSGFNLQNISVEALAHVYENTLVDPEQRRTLGTHATPPGIAEYMVRHLPFEGLPLHDRTVFEPFAGQAVFLIAALGRLRELLPSDWTAAQRHQYFVQSLSGMELDPFALEVAKLSLILADYPNPNGWHLLEGDVFTDPRVETELARARIVLCNPPFEDFRLQERHRHSEATTANKAVEIVNRVLAHAPSLLGFVLPRVFVDGQATRETRRQLIETYRQIDVVNLPDRVFAHSEAETVLILASSASGAQRRLRTAAVEKSDYNRFLRTGQPSWEAEEPFLPTDDEQVPTLWRHPMHRVWSALAHLPELKTVASVHRGIEFNVPLDSHAASLVSTEEHPGFARGLARVTDGFEPFFVRDTVFLNTAPELMLYSAHRLPWSQPKVIVNAARLTRGPWKIAAVPDNSGLVCYQNFHGIWPLGDVQIEVIAAILNGPIANCYVDSHEGGRHIKVRTLRSIPVPRFSARDVETITSLVHQYRSAREGWLVSGDSGPAASQATLCRRLLLEIDSEILAAYDLSPRLEREVLRRFSGHQRPVPVEFTSYYPPGFRPALPLHFLISEEAADATAMRTLARLPVLSDPVISSALAFVDEID